MSAGEPYIYYYFFRYKATMPATIYYALFHFLVVLLTAMSVRDVSCSPGNRQFLKCQGARDFKTRLLCIQASQQQSSSQMQTSVNPFVQLSTLIEDDIEQVASLLSATFDGPFPHWWQGLQKKLCLWNTEIQLRSRYEKFILRKKMLHQMTVAKVEGAVAGYIEIGLIPPPTQLSTLSIFGGEEPDDICVDLSWDQQADPRVKILVPHIGNLVVGEKYRRKGIAMSLMKSVIAAAEAWGASVVFCAVEDGNTAAMDLYTNRLGFEVALFERADGLALKKDRYLLKKRIRSNVDALSRDKLPTPAPATNHRDCSTSSVNQPSVSSTQEKQEQQEHEQT